MTRNWRIDNLQSRGRSLSISLSPPHLIPSSSLPLPNHQLSVKITRMSLVISNKEESKSGKRRAADALMDRLAQVIDETDEKGAIERVVELQAQFPEASPEELAQKLILQKCRDTAVVGATTSGAMLIPGIGTIAGLTLGIAADLGITFKMQAELVLEIATLYGHQLTPEEKRRTVLLVTGLSAGTTTLAHRAGKSVSKRVTARVGSKYVTKAIPVVGMVASASTNAAMTYVIGNRAQKLFSLGPEAMEDWQTSAAALTGLNRELITNGAKKGGELVKGAGETAVSGAKKAGSAIKNKRPRRRKKIETHEDEIIPVFSKSSTND